MPQVRIICRDGTRDDFDVESEESVTASVVDGRVAVIANQPGPEEADLVSNLPVEDVPAVVTTPGSESDGEIEMEARPKSHGNAGFFAFSEHTLRRHVQRAWQQNGNAFGV